MRSAGEYCQDCVFFSGMDVNKGFCRWRPPAPDPNSYDLLAHYPVVETSDWCGQFERDEE